MWHHEKTKPEFWMALSKIGCFSSTVCNVSAASFRIMVPDSEVIRSATILSAEYPLSEQF